MMGVTGYRYKKDLKASVGKPLNYVETSVFGEEFKPDGTFCVIGPDAFRNCAWFTVVTTVDGLIAKVT